MNLFWFLCNIYWSTLCLCIEAKVHRKTAQAIGLSVRLASGSKVYAKALARSGRHDMDVERRIAAANTVNDALAALMRRRNVSTAARLAVHNAVLVPTLLYDSETWVLQKKNKRKMNAVEMRSIRRICGVSVAD